MSEPTVWDELSARWAKQFCVDTADVPKLMERGRQLEKEVEGLRHELKLANSAGSIAEAELAQARAEKEDLDKCVRGLGERIDAQGADLAQARAEVAVIWQAVEEFHVCQLGKGSCAACVVLRSRPESARLWIAERDVMREALQGAMAIISVQGMKYPKGDAALDGSELKRRTTDEEKN